MRLLFLKFKIIIVVCLAIFLGSVIAQAETRLMWDASTGDVAGYNIHYSNLIGNYDQSEDVGNVTEFLLKDFTVPLSPGITYFFIVRAYNASGESGDSNSVTYFVPIPVPGEPGNVRIVTETITKTVVKTKTTITPIE